MATPSPVAAAHPLANLLLDVDAGAPSDPLITMGTTVVPRGHARTAALDIAAALSDLGIGPDDAVATVLPTSPAAVVALFGIWTVGAVAVPVNPRLVDAEIARLLAATSVAAVIATPGDDARWPDAGPSVRRLAVAETFPTASGGEWSTEVRATSPAGSGGRDPDRDAERVAHEEGAAIVLTTSGTTGAPKPVVLNAASVLAGIDTVLGSLRGAPRPSEAAPGSAARVEAAPSRTPPPNLIPVPLALWAGVYNTLFAFRAGAGVVLLDPFRTSAFADAVRTHAIKSTVLAPAMITMLTDDSEIESLAPLRIVRSITAPLSPHQARRFHERFGVVVLNSYGQTELGGEVIGWRAADARMFGEQKLGAIGRAHAGIDVRVLDGDVEVEPGAEGELCIRSPYMMQGYLAHETASRLTADGFLRTGDIGHVDADGFVWLSGRVSDLIIRGGMKVFPGDVEEVLLTHPAVRDVAVVGVPDERLGEVPWAFVVLDPTDEAHDASAVLDAHCRTDLAAYKVPVRFVAVDELPRNDVGKVLRRELIERAALAGEDH
jgi:acyl-CoA synthetase (AMP-forming)/AMP-acid ligase II